MFSPASAVITPPVTLIPALAVINPTESTFITSSYVKVPPIETLPRNFASPVNVDSPPTLKFLETIKSLYVKSPPPVAVGAPVSPIYLYPTI